MATVHWNRGCSDGFDEDRSHSFEDPMAVADSGHSEVCRAADDCRAAADKHRGVDEGPRP